MPHAIHILCVFTRYGQKMVGNGLTTRGNQAYSRLSTTHGHITDCKLDSVVHADVCVVI